MTYELGNLLFGNSRGEYPIPRNEGFEEELWRLFEALAEVDGQEPDTYIPYGVSFENDTFWVMPYWWGDCNCGWDEIDNGQLRISELRHRDDCYFYEYESLSDRFPYSDRSRDHERYLDALRSLYEKHGWSADGPSWWHGCTSRCSCDFREREDRIVNEYAKEFGFMGHKPECGLMRDNFHHRASGFGLQWYKYPMRDSFTNHKITLKEFSTLIDECIASLKRSS